MKPALKEAGLVIPEPVGAEGTRASGATVSQDLLVLTKARLSTLVLITTFVGFCLGSPGGISWVALLHCLLGTALVAAGAAVFNQVLERGPDALMKRTVDRPLPAGRMSLRFAVGFGAAISLVGTAWLGLFTTGLAAGLAVLTWLTYVAAYTPLKRLSSTCTLVGAVSGAIPPVIGYVAAGRGLDAMAWFLFGVLFLWQMPHFLAINWLYREEYERAGFVMWSNGDASGVRSAAISLAFALALAGLTVGWVPSGAFTPVYTAGALVLGAVWCGAAIHWLIRRDRVRARLLFFLSLLYLPCVLALMVFARP